MTLVTKDGQVFTGYSSRAARQLAEKVGYNRTANADIVVVADRARQALGKGCGAGCAEVDAISQAINAGASLRGATISAAQVGSRGARAPGTAHNFCTSCADWVPSLLN